MPQSNNFFKDEKINPNSSGIISQPHWQNNASLPVDGAQNGLVVEDS